MIVACVLRRRRLSGLVPRGRPTGLTADQFRARGYRTGSGQIGSPSSHEDLALPDDVERSAALQLSSTPGSKMCVLMMSLHRTPAQSNCPYGVFARTIAGPSDTRTGSDRRVNFYYFHHVGPVSGRTSGPKVQYFRAEPGSEGMFRVAKR